MMYVFAYRHIRRFPLWWGKLLLSRTIILLRRVKMGSAGEASFGVYLPVLIVYAIVVASLLFCIYIRPFYSLYGYQLLWLGFPATFGVPGCHRNPLKFFRL